MDTISGYFISGYDIKMYCKISEINKNTPNYICVLSFGTGMKKFCMTAIYNNTKPDEIYIDRVENNDLCVIDGRLKNYSKGTIKIVKTALYVIKSLFPTVTRLNLNDNSQIYCEENSKMFKLSMSYDYILKYNETWYQKNFNAELSGFISKKYNNSQPLVTAKDNSMMSNFINSLKVLDETIMPYTLAINIFPQFSDYKHQYLAAKTPREFIHLLRQSLGKEFCFKVGKWLNQYMLSLQIKLSAEYWYISTSNIEIVPNFNMQQITQANAKRILNGGSRKTLKRRDIYKMISDSNLSDVFVGSYEKEYS